MSAQNTLQQILQKDQEIQQLQETFEKATDTDKAAALSTVYREMLEATSEEDAISPQIMRVTEMICGLDNPAVLLSVGLSHENEDIRQLAGEGMIVVGVEDGLDAVIPAVDAALEKQDISTREMPLILAEIDAPGAAAQIHRFLHSSDIEIVYSAIEACANLEDPESIEPLRALLTDQREIETDEEDGTITLGMLAEEAINLIDDDQE